MDPAIEQARVHDRDAELEFMADSIAALVFYVSADQRFRRVNCACEEFFGRSREDLIGRTILEVAGDLHYSVAFPCIQRALRGESVTFVSRLWHADRGPRDVQFSYTPHIGPEGRVAGFAAIGHEIHQRPQRETRVLDSIPDCVMILGQSGDILEINPACLRLLEAASLEEVTGRSLYPFLQQPQVEEFRQLQETIFAGADGGALDVSLTGLGGTEKRLELRLVPLHDEWGSVTATLSSIRDVTEQRLAEEALRNANTMLGAIVASSPLPIVALTSDGNITVWNPAAERLFGWSSHEVIGKPLPFIPEDKRDEHRRMRARDLAGEGFTNHQVRRRRKDGTPVDIRVSTAPLRDAQGRITGIMSLYVDVTATRRIEHELRESEARFRALVEQSPMATQVLAMDGSVVRANKSWERLWGVAATEISDFNAFEDSQLSDRGLLPFLDRARNGHAVEFPETAFVPASGARAGEVIWVRSAAYPIRNEAGTVTNVVLVQEDVTSRRRAEEALRESEEASRGMMHALPNLVWTMDSDGNRTFSNESWLNYTGQAADQARGTCWRDAIHPDDRARMDQVWRSAIIAGEQFEVKQRIRRAADGQWRWHLTRAYPLRGERGTVAKWVGSSTDIHDQADLTDRLTLALEASGMGDWRWDPQTDAVTLSDRASEIFGLPRGRSTTWTDLRKLLEASDAERARKEVIRVLEERTAYDIEYRLLTGRWVSVSGRGIYDDDGNVHCMLGVVQDITSRKQSEKELEETLRREQVARQTAEQLNTVGALLAAELDTQRLTQTITDIATRLAGAAFGAFFHNVVRADGESYMLYTLSGVPREAFAGFSMPRNTEVFAPTFRGEGTIRSDDITKDPRYGKNAPRCGMPEGHLPVRSYLAVPVVSRSGEVLGGLFFGHSETGVFTDRSEEIVRGIAGQAAIALDNARLFEQTQRSQAELVRANEELRRANADLEQFAYSASHDLQEPLRMVSVYSQILGRKYGDALDEQGQEFLGYAVKGAQRMEALVRDLLAYTRAVAGGDIEQAVAVSADLALDEALSNLSHSIGNTGARIERQPLPHVRVIRVHLVQLFQNIVANALKYRSDDAPLVRVWAEQEQHYWRMYVEDNGIGIPAEYAQQIFGLFKRLHTGDEYGGTGIGLAICQKIVERYSGSMWVEPAGRGRGSRFCFTVPGADFIRQRTQTGADLSGGG